MKTSIKANVVLKVGTIAFLWLLDLKRTWKFTAMTFVSGQYALRGAPSVTGIGGLYATGNGVDKVVTTAAEVPSTVDAQIASTCLCVSSL